MDARQIMVLNDIKAVIIHVSWSLDLVLYQPVLNNHARTSHINGSTRAQLTHSHFLFSLQEVKKSLQKKNSAKLQIFCG